MRITSDGIVTRVYDKKGDEVKLDIDRVTVNIEGGKPVVSSLLISHHPFDIDSDSSNFYIGYDGEIKHVKRIEFVDGTIWEKPE